MFPLILHINSEGYKYSNKPKGMDSKPKKNEAFKVFFLQVNKYNKMQNLNIKKLTIRNR